MYKNDLNTFYRKTVDIIYAFIVGQSFLQLDSLFIPITAISDWHRLVDLAAVFLAYFISIAGWITYHKSIVHRPHFGRWGNARYAVDLLILFLTYYLLRLSKPDGRTAYGETFTWLIPMLFLAYLVWDAIKFFEYRPYEKVGTKSLGTTLLFGFLFLLLSFVYHSVVAALPITPDNFWGTKSIEDQYFIAMAFVLTAAYRLAKWDVKSEIPPP